MSVCSKNGSVQTPNRPQIISEDGPYSLVVLPGHNRVQSACAEIVSAIRKLIISYTSAFRVNFVVETVVPDKVYDSSGVLDCIHFRICALHRPEIGWNFDRYEIQAELYHGIVSVAHNLFIFGTQTGRPALLFPNRVVFYQVISFQSVAVCALPRESRLVLTLYGRRKVPDTELEERIELGWTAQHLFKYGDPRWTLVQGN